MKTTKGMRNVLTKLPGSGWNCRKCNFSVPRYRGRYPKSCPECGIPLGLPVESKAKKLSNVLTELLVSKKPPHMIKKGDEVEIIVGPNKGKKATVVSFKSDKYMLKLKSGKTIEVPAHFVKD